MSNEVELFSSVTLVSAATVMTSAYVVRNGKGDIMYVSSGGFANFTRIGNSGHMWVRDGGYAANTAVSSGHVIVQWGGSASNTTIHSGGNVTVDSQGVVSYNNISGGRLAVGSYGRAEDNFLIGGGISAYGPSAVVDRTTLRDYGSLAIEGGAIAYTTEVNEYGYISVKSNGTIQGTTIRSAGSVCVSNGGSANSTTVSSCGFLYVNNGGTANSTTVNSGGYLYVSGGAVSSVSNGGTVNIGSGGVLNSVSVSNGGTVNILSCGIVSGSLQIAAGGVMSAYAGAAIDFTVLEQTVYSPALINNWSLISGGSDASYTITVKDDQTYGTYVLAGGAADFANTVTIKTAAGTELGTITVGSTLTSGYTTYSLNKNASVLSLDLTQAVVHEEVKLYSSGTLVSSAQIMTGKALGGNNSMGISSGGTAVNTTVTNYGIVSISSGGTATDTTVNSLGIIEVSNGGIVKSTKIVESAGYLYLYSGGTANDTAINNNGKMYVGGGTANSTTISAGSMCIYNGGTVNDTTVNYYGIMHVSNGGTANSTTLSNVMHVSNGGTVNNTTISGGGRMKVSSGGTANSTTISGGSMWVASGGTALQIKENGGYVEVDPNANVSFVENSFSGLIILANRATLHSGTTANSTTISGGMMTVYSGGTANNTTVKTGGSMYVSSDGIISGSLQIASGAAVVSTYQGAVIDFTVAEQTAAKTALINDWSLISGRNDASYTLTVNADQTYGSYVLAEGAADFANTITVKTTDNTELGTLTVGETKDLGGIDYTLAKNSGQLTLSIGAVAKESYFVTGDFAGADKDYLGKAGDDDSVLHIYQTGAEWGSTAMEEGWTFYDSLDFNGDGKADLLRSNATNKLVVGEVSNGDGSFSMEVLNALGDGWQILGTGDFNGNGYDDVLVANPTAASETVGLLGYWEGGTTWNLINGYSAEWEMVSTNDFNGDGKTDMLWKNSFVGEGGKTYNAYCTWIVDNANDWRMVSVANPEEWKFLCSGDFDGNNTADIAMINGEGVVGIWGINGGYLSSWSILSAVDTKTWEFAGAGDFNGDGTDDIAWCKVDTNLTGYWQISDKQLSSWQTIGTLA